MTLAVLLTHQHHGFASGWCASFDSLPPLSTQLDGLLKEVATVLSTSVYAAAKCNEESDLVSRLDDVMVVTSARVPEEF